MRRCAMKPLIFQDRAHAGRVLADALAGRDLGGETIVLGLPRGGVPVAAEIAARLHAPLDVLVVRKLGVPGHEELAMGALASGGVRVLHDAVVRAFHIPESAIEEVTAKERMELRRRERAYRGHEGTPEIDGKTVILVDDGIATGSTLRAAVRALRQHAPAKIIVAAPVASADAAARLRGETDDFIALAVPDDFRAVGEWYRDFSQTSDEEVARCLASHHGSGE